MAHINVKNWDGKAPRPCDWCGQPLNGGEKYIHKGTCYQQESRFYMQLGYDGDSDVKPPVGYRIVIPSKGRL